MTTIKLILISVLVASILSSCENKNQTDTKAIKPNDLFRKKIIPKITNQEDLKKFDTLLTALDNSGISFCQFTKKLIQLDDSCYAVAKKNFPDPMQQNKLMENHDTLIKALEGSYLNSLHLRKHFSIFAITAYSFSQEIKSFCETN